jgi:DNA replication protein DnaC
MENLKILLETLKLRNFSKNLNDHLNHHPDSREAIIETLKELCKSEISERSERTIAYRIEQARFKQIQTLDTFDFKYNSSTLKIKNRYLKLYTKDLITQGLCLLFVGSAGLGKTHLARAAGYFFCQQCLRVRFTTLTSMVVELRTADTTGTLNKTMLAYTQPALLIIDEIGYTNLREEESNLTFQIISQRYEYKRSTVITTNRPFGEWNQIFHNDAMAHALLDRLIEKSEVFHLEGKSYREANRKRLET